MKLTTTQLKYLVARYWLHYYPELNDKTWTRNPVGPDREIIPEEVGHFERTLFSAGLLVFSRKSIHDRTYNQPRFLHFEYRLEVSGYGASAIEPLCAMDLMHALGELLVSVERRPSLSLCSMLSVRAHYRGLYQRQRNALRHRPSYHLLARVMRHIPKSDLPELLVHGHEFIRGIASQRLLDTPDKGSHLYQYRFNGRGTGLFCEYVLPL